MDAREWLEAYRQAWERKDADEAATLFAEGATYRSNIFESPHQGPQGVRQYWLDVTASQEDVRVLFDPVGHPFCLYVDSHTT